MAKVRIPKASDAVEKGRARRATHAAGKAAKIEWFIREISDKIAHTMRERVRIATELVHSKVIQNISRPVTKGIGPRGGRVVTDRSKPGEYPKADTTRLMKDIFKKFGGSKKGSYDGYIGTTLDYGLILETNIRLDRSFLRKTLNEERSKVMRILSGPIK